VGRVSNFKVGSYKNLLEGREVLKRVSLRLSIFPQSVNRVQEIRGVHNGGGEARGRVPVCEVGGEGYTHWNVIRDVGTSFVLVGEGVDVLIGGKRGYRVMVSVSVGGESVSRCGVKSAVGCEGSNRGIVETMIEAIQPRRDD
jgi:hypothetical protein